MKRTVPLVAVTACLALSLSDAAEPTYVKKPGRVETIVASLEAAGVPALQGKWFVIGPFDNVGAEGFDAVHPPEKAIDLAKTYPGKDGAKVAWSEFKIFAIGKVVNLARYPMNDHACVYLFHEIDAVEPVALPIAVGSDDGIAIWLNGKKILSENVVRGAAADQNKAVLNLNAGKNRLLVKVCNLAGNWEVYLAPEMPASWPASVRKQLERDYPVASAAAPTASASAEAKHYRMVTLPVPKDCTLEVGGLAFRPDGKLLACTRRGEVWLVHNPGADDPADVKFTLFARGLHESLGLHVDGKDVFVCQRPELTRLISRDGDTADEFVTVCDKWGVSGDYHEFAFGPARDKQGNFYVTLNVGFGGGHQSKAPWRGWCVKITPKGEMVPFATGLRSPNGLAMSPDGDLFYADNQGEWVATNKLHHIREGDYFGHPAGLRWAKQSPFAKSLLDTYPSGMLYDGQKGQSRDGLPQHTPPCIWFPYGRMGQSASEPIWDTTGGKFGPFAGQCFVGDQTKSMVMRVDLQKVNGRYQGACFPFRLGFECGVNRLAFGPDGSLFAGMTSRGWGSVGGKPYGLQRLIYTGVLPFEIQTMRLTKSGFDLTFTKPVDTATAEKVASFSMQSFTYNYWSTYGSPEVDHKAEKVQGVKVSADRKTVSLVLDGLRKGRVYELHADGVRSADGEALLHTEGYYTLNEIPGSP